MGFDFKVSCDLGKTQLGVVPPSYLLTKQSLSLSTLDVLELFEEKSMQDY